MVSAKRRTVDFLKVPDRENGFTVYGKNAGAHRLLILHSLVKLDAMTIAEAQTKVDSWITTTGIRYFSELTNMAILTEEVGEVARLMSRIYGDQSFKESDKEKNLSDELADVLWVLICIANQTGVNLEQALEKNFEKKTTRDADRHRQNPKL